MICRPDKNLIIWGGKYDWEKVEEFIRKLIDEKLSSMQVSNEIGMESEKIDKESLEEDVARMLENINLF